MRRCVIGILLLSLVVAGGCMPQAGAPQGAYMDVSPAEAKALIDANPDLIIIDVSIRFHFMFLSHNYKLSRVFWL